MKFDPTSDGKQTTFTQQAGARELTTTTKDGTVTSAVWNDAGTLVQQSVRQTDGTTTVRYFADDPSIALVTQTVVYKGDQLISTLDENRDGTIDLTNYNEIGVAADTLRYDAQANLIGRSVELESGTGLDLRFGRDGR